MGSTVAGILLCLLAGLCNGSHMVPLNRVLARANSWKYEQAWLVFSLLALFVFPWAFAFIFVHVGAFSEAIHQQWLSFWMLIIFGFLWGIGGTLFGLAITKVGMAIGYGVIMALVAGVGTAAPLVVAHSEKIRETQGILTLVGLAVILFGVVVCSYAYHLRELHAKQHGASQETPKQAESESGNGEGGTGVHLANSPSSPTGEAKASDGRGDVYVDSTQQDEEAVPLKDTASNEHDHSARHRVSEDAVVSVTPKQAEPKAVAKSSSSLFGIALCIIAGVFSAMLNVAFDLGDDLRDELEEQGTREVTASLALWTIAVGVGGCIPNFLYATYLLHTRKSLHTFAHASNRWYDLAAIVLMAVLWEGQIYAYGCGSVLLGDLGTVVGWPLSMCCTLVVANGWGLLLGEWTNAGKRAVLTMVTGMAVVAIAFAIIVVGLSV